MHSRPEALLLSSHLNCRMQLVISAQDVLTVRVGDAQIRAMRLFHRAQQDTRRPQTDSHETLGRGVGAYMGIVKVVKSR